MCFLLLAPGLKLAPPSNKRRILEQNYFISAAPRKANEDNEEFLLVDFSDDPDDFIGIF